MDEADKQEFADLRALVIEDDAGGMAIIGVMMRYLGIKAYINATGEGALAMAHAMLPPPQIIFVDLRLPRVTGYDVLKEIRSDQRLQDVIVVAMTAQDADTEIPKAKAAGFDAFIGKPISRTRFPRQLRRILRRESVWETY